MASGGRFDPGDDLLPTPGLRDSPLPDPGARGAARGAVLRRRPERGRLRDAGLCTSGSTRSGAATVRQLQRSVAVARAALKPSRAPHERPVFLREVIAALPQGARVLDAGCGPGSWPYPIRPDLEVTAFDIKF